MSDGLERLDLANSGGRIGYEHLHRYAICRDRAHGRRVLDVACGTGYGTYLLSEVASEATGLDIDPGALEIASRRYRRANLNFVEASAYDLPFADASFDLIVANEMIEHIEDHDAFLAEAKRVLAKGGTFMVSTPNKSVYNRYKAPNPYHVSELEAGEFETLLKKHFEHVSLTGLRMALVSAAFDLHGRHKPGNMGAAKTYVSRQGKSKTKPAIENDELRLSDAEYVLATCSDAPIDEPSLQSSIYVSRYDDLWLEHEKIMAWASQLHEEDEKLREDLRTARAELEQAANGEKQPAAELTTLRSSAEVTSRLLGRLAGGEVQPDLGSITEAMFGINERLIRQSVQLERFEHVEEQSARLTSRVETLTAERDRLETSLRALLDDLAEVQGQSREARGQVVLLTREKENLEQQLSRAIDEGRAEADRLREEQEQLRAELQAERERSERARTAAEDEARVSAAKAEEHLGRLSGALEQAKNEAARVRADHERLRADLVAERQRYEQQVRDSEGRLSAGGGHIALPPPGHPRPNADGSTARHQAADQRLTTAIAHRHSRLSAIQQQVRREIACATDVREHIPPAPSKRNGLWRKVVRPKADLGPLLNTQFVSEQLGSDRKISAHDYLHDPALFALDPNPLFSADEYLQRYPDVRDAGVSPLKHYLEHGWREGRSPHRFFANDWYLKQNPDVLEAGLNPLLHYLEHGWKEGRKPNPVFDPQAYLERHPDVWEAGVEPLSHFIQFGAAEQREVPLQGLEADWREAVGCGEGGNFLDYLLFGPLLEAGPQPEPEAHNGLIWPPQPLNEFWLPQDLRNYLIESNRESVIPLYQYLYSVMAAYSDETEEFTRSDTCSTLLDRVRMQSRSKAGSLNGPPTASIIVPVYNNFLDTVLCLASLLEQESQSTFEVIIADDASTDPSADLWSTIGGVVRHARQPHNLGFLGNCNAAAEKAVGQTIVLLNNDTLVLPDWLDNLLQPFSTFDRVGLVGSKLINWDGTLQEAGGIFWNDASAWNFGRGSDPLAPEFNYVKNVDYCSGASIAVPTSIWQEMGGFDPVFQPAYCEDSDLAFRLRAAGYQTLYQPHSEVVHHEGRSHGRDVNSGIKAYQLANQQRLLERWGAVLASEHYPNAHEVLKARDRSGGKRHILVVDHYIPKWDHDAGSRTIYQYIEIFIQLGCQVTFWPDNLYLDPIYGPALQALGVEVIYGPKYRQGFEAFIKERAQLYDAVFLSRPHVAINYLPAIRSHTKAKTLYYGHDLHFRRLEAALKVGEQVDPSSIEAIKAQELEVCSLSDVIFYPDPAEVAVISDTLKPHQQAFANPVFVYGDDQIAAARARIDRLREQKANRLFFVGGFNHSPNREGIIWFVNEVLPLVRQQVPDVRLNIAGSNPPDDVRNLASAGVAVLGRVSDQRLEELYLEASLAVAPLRFGAGVKGKVIEALALGVPCATTSTGAQGIVSDRPCLFVGDEPDELAAVVVQALTDRQVAAERVGHGLDFIEQRYGRKNLVELFRRLI